MPSHLRNGQDLSGEQRRRYVEAGLPHPSGQRPVQRVEGQPPISQPSSDEGPGSESRSSSDPGQLPSHLFGVKIGNVDPSASSGGPPDRTAVGSNAVGGEKNLEPLGNYPPNGLNPSSSCRQSTTRDWFMYDEAKKTNDLVVMKAALTQAISSQELISRVMSHDKLMDVCENWLAEAEMDIMFPQRRTTNVPTPPETKTPVHQTEPSSPQEDVAMAYQGPTPAQATAPPASSTSSVHQTNLNSAYAPVQSQAQNYAQQAVQHAMDASNYVNQAPQHGQFQNFVPNYAPVQNSAPAENLLPAQNSVMNYAPVQNSAPSYSMPSQQNLNQATYEHPRPPQQQQGSAATSHQAGPPFNGRQNHRASEGTDFTTTATN
ncbi:hypothetical protein PSHT_12369 [Puccinia striiformis]|uniref:Uncharacterized protein n=1 Tax=Puccinia striiformis TaxID=27350 RepID=A0A2S4UXC0_9BASI|nr:hypothetical protein PSHT_12369 [Puccinia striiformis]